MRFWLKVRHRLPSLARCIFDAPRSAIKRTIRAHATQFPRRGLVSKNQFALRPTFRGPAPD